MTLDIVFEIIGYVGSGLVIVSMLMTSVVKLRIINTVGSVIFCIYAFCIHSYPTAAMQICLIIINLVSLYKLISIKKDYSIVALKKTDSYLSYFLNNYKKDIKKYFPQSPEDTQKLIDSGDLFYLVSCDLNPAGIFIASTDPSDAKKLRAKLDYTSPRYRDGSAGKFLYEYLAGQGYSTVYTDNSCPSHLNYLKKMGFKKSRSENLLEYEKLL